MAHPILVERRDAGETVDNADGPQAHQINAEPQSRCPVTVGCGGRQDRQQVMMLMPKDFSEGVAAVDGKRPPQYPDR